MSGTTRFLPIICDPRSTSHAGIVSNGQAKIGCTLLDRRATGRHLQPDSNALIARPGTRRHPTDGAIMRVIFYEQESWLYRGGSITWRIVPARPDIGRGPSWLKDQTALYGDAHCAATIVSKQWNLARTRRPRRSAPGTRHFKIFLRILFPVTL
jgi:hypothetical protein